MPDAIYLYKTGYWKDTDRNQRAGSEALDYVGRCFSEGTTGTCLIVKFATKRGEFNDFQKWYIYPAIISDADIWSIITNADRGGVSVGKGYHKKVHPLLHTTKYERVQPPMLRIYLNRYWYYKNEIWTTAPGYYTYMRCRSYTDISVKEMPYIVSINADRGFYLSAAHFMSGVNGYDDIPAYNKKTFAYLLPNDNDVKPSTFYSSDPFQISSTMYGAGLKKQTIWGMIRNSSIFIIFEQIQGTYTREMSYNVNGLFELVRLSS